jgi:hypothetical protein
MNWNAVGAIGEIVGAIAVVATLIYLAGQIRQATHATQAACFQAASALEQEFLLVLGQDPATARTWGTYMFGDPGMLSEGERMQAVFLMGSLIRRLENMYHQHKLGTISDGAWSSRHEMFAAVARSRAFAHFMTAPASKFVGQEFVGFMRRLTPNDVASSDDNPPDGPTDRSSSTDTPRRAGRFRR